MTPLTLFLIVFLGIQLFYIFKMLRQERLWQEERFARVLSEKREYQQMFLTMLDKQITNVDRVLEKNSPKASA